MYQGSTFTNTANWLNSNYHDLVQEIGKPLAEKDTIYQSYIQVNGNIYSSDNFSTTVGVYSVEEGKKYHVQYVTGNEYTRPYAFYDTNGSVLSDDNTFPEIPSGSDNGISVNTVIVTPAKATTLKITYNNTVPVVIVECTERFLRKVELSGIENKIDEIDKTISGDSGLSETIEFTTTYQQIELSFTIPKGCVIHLSGDVNQITCRTNSADETYQTVTNGIVADRDINYVKNSTSLGVVTIGFDNKASGLLERVSALEHFTNGLNLSETIEFTATYQQKELSFTIPKGCVIHLSGDVTQITCRTNSTDETYQTVTNGIVADRDINYVRSGNTYGSVTISIVERSIPETLQTIQEILGYTETSLAEQETLAQSYIHLTSGAIASSGTPSTTVGVYEIPTEISALAISMCTANQYTRPYAFYDVNGSVLSDNNTFPEITGNGIVVSSINLIIPENAVTFKITYNNTHSHTVNFITKNFVTEAQLQALSNRVDELEQSINASKEGTGIAYRISSKFMLRPLKILGVGNSWTNNATAYLGNILSGLGVKVEINVSYAGGATLQSYWNNIKNNAAAYQFRKWREGQGWIEPDTNSTYKDILLADDWDILTHQQQSGNGGNYPSFQPYLHDIINWEKNLVKVMPLFFMHATWAYPNGYDYEQFETLYGSDTDTMYNAILEAYNQAMVDEGVDNVMPSAPMIQQVRTLGIPDIDTADGGSHLNINGQFTVACVWAEMLLRNYFDQSVTSDLSILNSTYKPSALSDENAMTIRKLAKEIVENVRTYFPMQKL